MRDVLLAFKFCSDTKSHSSVKWNSRAITDRYSESGQELERVRISLTTDLEILYKTWDRLCGLVVRVLGYRSGGPGSIPGTKKVVGLERGPLSLVSTTEELLDRKVAAPV
jgi:hypothetical protein